MVAARTWEKGERGEFFNGYRVLILRNEKVLQFGYIPMYIYLTLLTINLKMAKMVIFTLSILYHSLKNYIIFNIVL